MDIRPSATATEYSTNEKALVLRPSFEPQTYPLSFRLTRE
jgi:hypothetical protein